jgi:hypothetical protein
VSVTCTTGRSLPIAVCYSRITGLLDIPYTALRRPCDGQARAECFNAGGKPDERSNDVHGSPKVYYAVSTTYAIHAFTLFNESVTKYGTRAFPNHLVSLYAAVGA